MLAGLESVDDGDIIFHGKRVNDLPPQERGIGFVFQNYALFKHMTVEDNIAFGLEVKKWSKAKIKARIAELVELTGLSGFEKRYPHQLSGGQRQRVAFARALAPEPQLLLLDEPFAAIDAKIRQELRSWLRDMIDRLGITSIFVTHDQDEAIEVADQIMIINKGRMEQKGTPWEIYKNPQTPFVAGFVGESTHLDHIDALKGFGGRLQNAKAIVRPEFVEVGNSHEISFPSAAEKGTIRNVFFRGTSWQVDVEVNGHRLFAYRTLDQEALHPGDEVHVLIHRIYLYNDEETLALENALKFDPMPVHI
jgi:sulfate transport system ATP-binding protein